MLAPRSPLIMTMTPFADTGSASDRLPNVPEMFIDVADEGALDHLLGAHGGHPGEYGAGLRELGIGKGPHGRGGRSRPLLEERDRLCLGAPGELLGMLRVHFIEHLSRERRQCLAGGDRLDNMSNWLIASGAVGRPHRDRPLLGRAPLLPVSTPYPLH